MKKRESDDYLNKVTVLRKGSFSTEKPFGIENIHANSKTMKKYLERLSKFG